MFLVFCLGLLHLDIFIESRFSLKVTGIPYLALSFDEGMSSLLAHEPTDRLVGRELVGGVSDLLLKFQLKFQLPGHVLILIIARDHVSVQ